MRILLDQPLKLKAGETIQREFEIVAGQLALPAGVSHFKIVSRATPGDDTENFDMTFITPTKKGQK